MGCKMKKFLFLMILLTGLFSCSFAATFTFEGNKYSNFSGTYGGDYNTYISDLVAIDEKTHNQYSAALPNLEVSDDIVSNYPYQIFCMYNGTYYYIFSDSPIYAKGPYSTESVDYILNKYCGLFTIQNSNIYQFTTNGSSWNSTFYTRSAKQKFFSVSWASPIYYANHEILHYVNGSVIYPYNDKLVLPEMENPFNNNELVEILNRLQNSEALNDYLPDNYTDYFIMYNKETGQYKAYFYPKTKLPYGRVAPEGFVHNGGVSYEEKTYILDIGSQHYYDSGQYSEFYSESLEYPIYTFVTFGSSSDFWYHDTLTSNSISETIYRYDNSPIILSTKDFHFYFADEEGNVPVDDDGKIADSNTIVITKPLLKDEESGNDVNTDVEIADKDSNDIWNAIFGIVNKILEGIKSIFLPSEDFLSSKANEILYKISFYTQLQDTYNDLIEVVTSDSNGAPQVIVDFSLSKDSILSNCGSANVLDFSWYEPFKPVVDLFIIAFVYGVFIYRFIVELPNIIAGISQGFEYVPLSNDSPYSGSGKIGFKTPGGDKK